MTTETKPVIEFWDLDRLIPYANNAKKHSPADIAKLKKSIQAFKISNPINVEPDGTIITGHGRRLAAIELRDEGDERFKKVPVAVRHDLSKAEADALRLSDNEVTGKDYDTEKLQAELAALYETGFDMDSMGFDAKTLEFMSSDLGAFAPDLQDVFVEDIETAVEEQKTENDRKAAEIDETAAPIADAFGFKRMTVAQSRTIRGYVAQVEALSGKKGVEAVIEALSRSVDRWS